MTCNLHYYINTAEFKWLEHLWNHENIMLMSGYHSARSGGIIGIFFSIFFNMKECCMFSLELPHGGDSNEYSQHTIMALSI